MLTQQTVDTLRSNTCLQFWIEDRISGKGIAFRGNYWQVTMEALAMAEVDGVSYAVWFIQGEANVKLYEANYYHGLGVKGGPAVKGLLL